MAKSRIICTIVLFAISLNLFGCFSSEEIESESSIESDSSIESESSTKTEPKTEDLMAGINPNEVSLPESIDAGIIKTSDFSLDLFRATSKDGENTLISPLSVFYALSMTANGADGETLEEMESVLGMSREEMNVFLHAYLNSLPQNEKCKLSLANSIWFKDDAAFTVNQSFLQVNADYYGADIYKASFDGQTLKDINGWVNDKTDGMIPKVLDDIPAQAVMYLINALAFDAEWASPYSEWNVYDGKFTREDGTALDVKMMRGSDGVYIEDENATGFIKYYSGWI